MATEQQDAQSSAQAGGALSGVKAAMRKAVQGAQAAVSSLSTPTDERPEGAPAAKAPTILTSTPSETTVAAPPPAKKAPASIPPKGGSAKATPVAPKAAGDAPAPPPAPRKTQGPRVVPVGGPVPSGAPRRVRLAVSRVDPWSVMKLSFLLSVAVGIMIVVATVAAWTMIDNLGVFASTDQLIREILGAESAEKLNIMQYFTFDRFVSGATLIAVVDVVLLTALSTIGAFLYNITAALVGGLHLTLTDE
ncbi:MAG: hypothetical protein GX593_01380 [Actinomycetales bacterium]|nr:hypothetical protein [Actinomycetales bacterium]